MVNTAPMAPAMISAVMPPNTFVLNIHSSIARRREGSSSLAAAHHPK